MDSNDDFFWSFDRCDRRGRRSSCATRRCRGFPLCRVPFSTSRTQPQHAPSRLSFHYDGSSDAPRILQSNRQHTYGLLQTLMATVATPCFDTTAALFPLWHNRNKAKCARYPRAYRFQHLTRVLAFWVFGPDVVGQTVSGVQRFPQI